MILVGKKDAINKPSLPLQLCSPFFFSTLCSICSLAHSSLSPLLHLLLDPLCPFFPLLHLSSYFLLVLCSFPLFFFSLLSLLISAAMIATPRSVPLATTTLISTMRISILPRCLLRTMFILTLLVRYLSSVNNSDDGP